MREFSFIFLSITYHGEFITFANAVQVEFAHRIKCAWATFTSEGGVDITKVRSEGQTQTLRRHSGPITPLRIRNVDDAKNMKNKFQTTQRRMMRMIIQTKRKTGKGHAAAHAASVDDTADVAPPRPRQRFGGRPDAAMTQTASRASTKSWKTIQRTSQHRGSTTQREQGTKRTTCQQRKESCDIFHLCTGVICYRVSTALAYTSAGPLSLKRNGVSTDHTTSGCTDQHTAHSSHKSRPESSSRARFTGGRQG